MIDFRRVVLPAPLRPEQAQDLPGLDREIDALQHVAAVVVAVQVLDREQRHHAVPR